MTPASIQVAAPVAPPITPSGAPRPSRPIALSPGDIMPARVVTRRAVMAATKAERAEYARRLALLRSAPRGGIVKAQHRLVDATTALLMAEIAVRAGEARDLR